MKKFLVPVLGFVLALGLFQFGAPEIAFANGGATDVRGGLISGEDNLTTIAGATGGEGSFRAIIKRIVDFILLFLGLIAVIMIIYGGFLYVTSAGNEENVGKGKKILIYAAIGIVIILISFALVNTLLGAANTSREAADTTSTGDASNTGNQTSSPGRQ